MNRVHVERLYDRLTKKFVSWAQGRQDIGAALIVGRNATVVYIDTGAKNLEALRLYGKMGFNEFGQTIHLKKTIV